MIKKRIIVSSRVRRITGGFGFIPHRFLSDGFLTTLTQKEILLYFFLILVSDRNGISFYSYDNICTLLQLTIDDYIQARDGLIESSLIAFDGTLFQVLELPQKPIVKNSSSQDPANVMKLICQSLNGAGK